MKGNSSMKRFTHCVGSDDYGVRKTTHYERSCASGYERSYKRATKEAGSNAHVALNHAGLDSLSRRQIRARLRNVTTELLLIKTDRQEVSHDQANRAA